MGRPTKYTPARAERITSALRSGNTRKNAAACGGVSFVTFRSWEENNVDFAQAVEKAESDCEARCVAVIQKAAAGYDVVKRTLRTKTYERQGAVATDTEETVTTSHEFCWQAAAWWLERRRPGDFKRRTGTGLTDWAGDGEPAPVISIVIHPPSEVTDVAAASRAY